LVFVFLIVLAAVGYILVLNQVDSVALKRREALITELSRA
jgi:hypothetical protein